MFAHMKRMLAVPLLLASCAPADRREALPLPADRLEEPDILEHVLDDPPFRQCRREDGGETTFAVYGDFELDEAVRALTGIPRPWTVTKMLTAYGKEEDIKRREHILRVLAASRNARAALLLGRELTDTNYDIRLAATYGLLYYYGIPRGSGGTEGHVHAVQEWWAENKARCRREAGLPATRD
jgi:hypothetical protein